MRSGVAALHPVTRRPYYVPHCPRISRSTVALDWAWWKLHNRSRMRSLNIDRTDYFDSKIIENSKLRIRYRPSSLKVYPIQTSKSVHVRSSAFVQCRYILSFKIIGWGVGPKLRSLSVYNKVFPQCYLRYNSITIYYITFCSTILELRPSNLNQMFA